MRKAFAAHRGEEIDTQGDSFFAVFQTASDALAASVAIQRTLAAEQWPDGEAVRVRIGIHSGEASADDKRYVGFSVHRANRICAAAHGGQVLLSSATRELVEDDLPKDVFLRDLGSWRLKDIDRPERLTQAAADGLRVDFPQLRGAAPVKERPVTRRRTLLVSALAGVIAAAIAIPLFALGGGSGGSRALAAVGANAVGVIDPANAHITASVAVESGPGPIAVGAGSVWVANANANTVSRIDPGTRTVEQTIPVGHSPSGIAIADGFVWVSNGRDGTVSRIDPRVSGGRVIGQPIPVGNNPSGIWFGEGLLWVADSGDSTVTRIEPGSGRLVGSPILVAAGADSLAVGDGAVWVASKSAGSVTRIDPRSLSEQPINVGTGPSAIAVTPDAIWVVNALDGTVSRIDPTSNQELKYPVGDVPSGIAVSADGNAVWVSVEAEGTLKRIDPTTGAVAKTIGTGGQPAGVAVSKDAIYVTVRASRASHQGGTLTIAVPGSLPSPASMIDPATGYGDWQALPATNDGLVTYAHGLGTEGSQLVADLALSIPQPSSGGRTYTFQLRADVHYSTGALVRPADFRRAIERALATSGNAPPANYFSDIVGAKACVKARRRCDLSGGIVTGSNTISFHLTAPDPAFLYKLALPTADAVPADTPLKAQLPLPATGPYRIATYDTRRGFVRLIRNAHFREWSPVAQPAGYPDEIVEKWGYPGDVAAARAVQHGKADLTGLNDNNVPLAFLTDLGTRFASQLHENPILASGFIALNTRVRPFNDIRVRRAINYAVNRNHWVALRSGHLFQPSCQALPPGVPGYLRYCPYTRHPTLDGKYSGPDLKKAKDLVRASGSFGQPIAVVLTPGGYSAPALNYFISVLRSLGYRARLNVNASLYARASDSRLRVQAIGSGEGADYPLASAFLLPILSCSAYEPGTASNSNFSEFCNRHIDEIMNRAQAVQATDPQTAAALWRQADRQITDRAPYLVIFNPQTLDFTSRRVQNYIYSPESGALLDQMWVR